LTRTFLFTPADIVKLLRMSPFSLAVAVRIYL
jgi:hypothetical protein